MIKSYIAASRRTKLPNAEISSEYIKYYQWITKAIPQIRDNPELFITYSTDRKCELVKIDQKTYLIYDQYLGQSFNRLNRIQYALHGAPMLSQAYASKYVAERLLCNGHTGLAAFFAFASHQFEENVKSEGNPFETAQSDNIIRTNFTAVQEIFVIAHELAHHRWQLDTEYFRGEISSYINEFLEQTKQDLTNETGGLRKIYKDVLDSSPADYLEEIFADDYGSLIAFNVANALNIPAWQIATGIILAFKYLRLFRHLEILANHISKLHKEENTKKFAEQFSSLKKNIWDQSAGYIRRHQFREHFIRHRLWMACKKTTSYKPTDEMNISTIIEEYDENTEFPVVLDLVDRLKDSLTVELLSDLNTSIGMRADGVAFVDRMTGWKR